MLTPTGVVIGFEQMLYTVNEAAGSINVGVVVRNGQLRRSVVVTVSTEDGTAQGMHQPRQLSLNCPALVVYKKTTVPLLFVMATAH